MHLDDVENESALRVEQYLSKIKVVRNIAGKFIEFLAQLEEFQRKLWLKKKFVVEANYCISLDRIPEEFYAEISGNKAQCQEWSDLFGIDGKIDEGFLAKNPSLILDTTHFDVGFKARLIERYDAIDAECTGLLIHSDNFQALQALRSRYQGRVRCIHIDPPYNTQTSGFLYKNAYQHASWLTFMENRIESGLALLKDDGDFLCHIDENEYERLHILFEDSKTANAGTIIWDKRNPMLGGKGIATQHEYIIWRSGRTQPVYLRNKSILAMLGAARSFIEKHGGINEHSRKEYSRWVQNNDELSGGEKQYRFIDDEGRVYRGVAMGAPEPRTDPKFFEPVIHPITGGKCSPPSNGWSRTPETIRDLIEADEIIFGPDESVQPQKKVLLTEDSQRQIPSLIQDGRKGKNDLIALGLEFPYCHPVSLYEELVGASAQEPRDIVVDFFAGSGTTGHAVIALNEEDHLDRRYILVENGEHFDGVMLPRIKKVAYAIEWSNGKPSSQQGSSQFIKYLRLESYEDALNNLLLSRSKQQQSLLEKSEAQGAEGFKEQYVLRYMLDVETQGSQSLLNVQAFSDPTAYSLSVRLPGRDDCHELNVDLLETFSYLIGLDVAHISAPQTFSASFKPDDERRLRLDGRLKQDDSGPWWFRTVDGVTPDGRKTLVIWRKLTGDTEQDNLVLDEWFTRSGYSTQDYEFDLIYVNGDNNLENLRHPDETWKVRLIEEDFHRLMFDVENV
jgi:adenine-specific DNA-methyltransferase